MKEKDGKITNIAVVGDVTLDEFVEVKDGKKNILAENKGGALFVSNTLNSALYSNSEVSVLGYDSGELDSKNIPKVSWKVKMFNNESRGGGISQSVVRCFDPLQLGKNLNKKTYSEPKGHKARGKKFQMVVVQDLQIEGKTTLDKDDKWEWVFEERHLNIENESLPQKEKIPEISYPQIFIMVGRDLPNFKQPFWKKIMKEGNKKHKSLSSNSLAIIYADTLRIKGLAISKRISWERTAQGYLSELYTHPKMKELGKINHLIVRFGVSGAIYSYRIGRQRFHRLFFDPKAHQIGSHRDPAIDGDVIGN